MHWIMVLSHLVGSVLHLGQVVLEAVEEAVEAMSERDVVGGRDLVLVHADDLGAGRGGLGAAGA